MDLNQQLQEKAAREAQLLQQLEELKNVNSYLKNEVKRLIHERQESELLRSGWGLNESKWESGLGLGAEVCFERMRLEGEASSQRAAHHEELQKLQQQTEQQLSEQMAKLTKRAATLVTGVLPTLGPAGPSGSTDSSTSTSSSSHTLHVSSSSPKMQQQVEQLIHSYMAGDVSEDAAVGQLSQLHCRMQLLATPSHSEGPPPATTQNGGSAQENGVDGNSHREFHRTHTAPALGAAGAAQGLGPGMGGFYSQFVLAEPEKLRRLISRAGSINSRAGSAAGRGASVAGGPLPAGSSGAQATATAPALTDTDAAPAGSEASSSASVGWAGSWSSRLLSFGSSRFSSSGAKGAEAPAAPATALPAASAGAPAAAATTIGKAPQPPPACTSVSASTSRLSADAPAFSPAGPTPPTPSGPTAGAASTVGHDSGGATARALEGCSSSDAQPAARSTPDAPAAGAAAKPARAPSPSARSSARGGKGVAAVGQGTVRALRKSLEAAEGAHGEGAALADAVAALEGGEDLWGQAAPVGHPDQGLQLYKV